MQGQGAPRATALSADGALLATADDPNDRTSDLNYLHLLDRVAGKEVRPLEGRKGAAVHALAFSPDGRLLASSENDGAAWSVRLLDVASGKEIRRWDGAADFLVFSPDGKTLAGSGGTGLRLWEVATGSERRHFDGGGALAFSADGRTLASTRDAAVLLWDLTGAATAKRPVPLAADDRDAFWRDLADADAGRADRGMRALLADEGTVPLFRKRLRPVEPADDKRVARLLADLDDDDFDVRDKAGKALEQIAESAEPYLRRALEGKPAAEARQRLERLLDGLKTDAPDRLRLLRAVEVLERLGMPEARDLLRSLAKGAPGAFLTEQAKASLRRLGP